MTSVNAAVIQTASPDISRHPMDRKTYYWFADRLGFTPATIKEKVPKPLWQSFLDEAQRLGRQLNLTEVKAIVVGHERAGIIPPESKVSSQGSPKNNLIEFKPQLDKAVVSPPVKAGQAKQEEPASKAQPAGKSSTLDTTIKLPESPAKPAKKKARRSRPVNACIFRSNCKAAIPDSKEGWIVMQIGKKLLPKAICSGHREVLTDLGITFHTKAAVEERIKTILDEELAQERKRQREADEKRALEIAPNIVDFKAAAK